MDKELLRLKAFNKIQSNIIGLQGRHNNWKLTNHILEPEQINDVLDWIKKEEEIYRYILQLIIKDLPD